jgi:hypothetical protein
MKILYFIVMFKPQSMVISPSLFNNSNNVLMGVHPSYLTSYRLHVFPVNYPSGPSFICQIMFSALVEGNLGEYAPDPMECS